MRLKMRRLVGGLAVGSMLLAHAVASQAGTRMDPEIRDQAGDANYLQNPTPASVDAADILGVWFETQYVVEKDRAADGSVLRVRHVPTALRLHLETKGSPNALPNTGVAFRVIASSSASCRGFDSVLGLGSSGNPYVELKSCLGVHVRNAAFTIATVGNISTVTYPFSASVGILENGTVLKSGYQAVLAAIAPGADAGLLVKQTLMLIDIAGNIDGNRDFRVGSDVPLDIDCLTTPERPECAG